MCIAGPAGPGTRRKAKKHRWGFERALFNYASYMGHAARHDNTWTMDMFNFGQHDYDETAWLLHPCTNRNAKPPLQHKHV